MGSLEINPFSVLNELKNIFVQRFSGLFSDTSTITQHEVLIANKLFETYSDLLNDFAVENDIKSENLDTGAESFPIECDDITESESEGDDESYSEESESGKFTESQQCQPSKRSVPKASVTMERKMEIVQLWQKHPKWKIHTLKKHGAKEVTCISTLYRWKKQVEEGLNKLGKFKAIDKYVLDEFTKATKEGKIITTSHIKLWALQKFSEFDDGNIKFKAGKSWVDRFKRRHKISCR